MKKISLFYFLIQPAVVLSQLVNADTLIAIYKDPYIISRPYPNLYQKIFGILTDHCPYFLLYGVYLGIKVHQENEEGNAVVPFYRLLPVQS